MNPDPRHQLRQINDIAQRLLLDWTRYTETAGDLVDTGDRLGVHGGDTPDPTIAGVYANQRLAEVCNQISEALGILKIVEGAVTGVMQHHPETARQVDAAIRAARCSDALCTDNAHDSRGLCSRHLGLDLSIGTRRTSGA